VAPRLDDRVLDYGSEPKGKLSWFDLLMLLLVVATPVVIAVVSYRPLPPPAPPVTPPATAPIVN
jgi:hypothetical protein